LLTSCHTTYVKKKQRPGTYDAGDSIKVRLSEWNGTNVDIFPWYEGEDGILFRRNYVAIDQYKGREFHRDKLYPLTRMEYEGRRFPAPADTDWLLEHRYGDWKKPLRKNNDGVRR
jgi:hypothetical protein